MLDIRSGLRLPISEACKRGSYCLVKFYAMVKLRKSALERLEKATASTFTERVMPHTKAKSICFERRALPSASAGGKEVYFNDKDREAGVAFRRSSMSGWQVHR